MSTTYDGDESNNPTSITIPSGGDKPRASAWNPAFEGLMDKVKHALLGETAFEGEKSFADAVNLLAGLSISNPGDDVPSIQGTDVPTKRKLLLAFKIASTRWLRVYARARHTDQSEGVDITVNADWDATSSTWTFDDPTEPAKILELFSALALSLEGQDTSLVLRRKARSSLGYASSVPSDVDFAAGAHTITRNSGSWSIDGFVTGQYIRIAGTASNNGTHRITAVTTSVLTVKTTLVDESNVNGASITIRSYPWDDDEWDKRAAGISPFIPSKTFDPGRDLTTQKHMPVAWGIIDVNAGTVTITDAVNIASASCVGTDVNVVLNRSMGSVEYGVTVTSLFKASPLACAQISSSVDFDIRWSNSSHVAHDAGAVHLKAFVCVYGEVSPNVD